MVPNYSNFFAKGHFELNIRLKLLYEIHSGTKILQLKLNTLYDYKQAHFLQVLIMNIAKAVFQILQEGGGVSYKTIWIDLNGQTYGH